ncbi:MAG: PDDEXK family nuclease [Acidobacteriaceae bacterium]
MDKDAVVAGVAELIVWWLDTRRAKLKELRNDTMAVNPFLIPLLLALGDIDSFDELAHLLLAGHFSVGHATGFGKLIDEKVLPHVFKTTKLDSTFRKKLPWSDSMFDEI